MSWQATSYAKTLKIAPDGSLVTRTEKLLLLILADYHTTEKRGAWPSAKTLGQDSLVTTRHVRRILASVKRKGLICSSQRRNAHGDFDTNVYHFHALDCDDDHEGGSDMRSRPGDTVSSPSESGAKLTMTREVKGRDPRTQGVVTSRAASLYEDQVEPPNEESYREHNVCVPVRSKFSLEQILHYARKAHAYATKMEGRGQKVTGLKNPEGWAISARRSGEFDEIIERFYTDEPDMYTVSPPM